MKPKSHSEKPRWRPLFMATLFCLAGQTALSAYSLVMTNGYGDVYRMNLLRDRYNYQAYRGVCSYRGFSLSGCSTTGEVVMLRIPATAAMPEHFSILSTSKRWDTTMYVLNDVFRWINSTTMAGYENWYPFDMSCSVAMYINSGGFGSASLAKAPEKRVGPLRTESEDPVSDPRFIFSLLDEPAPAPRLGAKAYSLVMSNGYGDVYRMNLLRDRASYQAYRGVCSYRGFSLSGCSTTGEVVMLRILATATMPEHFSLVSTSLRWGTTMYFLNDVFRWINSTTMAGYENWYPFDMSCSVAMYISSGGLGPAGAEKSGPRTIRMPGPKLAPGGTNVIGALIPLTGDLTDLGASYQAAYEIALAEVTNTPGMPPIRLEIRDTVTDPLVAVEQLQQLYTQDVQVVLGPETSAECEGLLEFANDHGMLLLSSSSTALPLAVPDDNLMRLPVSDDRQAEALAEDIIYDGITNLLLLTRSDMYGEGLRSRLLQEFEARGGQVFYTGYCPRATGFIPEVVTQLNAIVSARAADVGAENIGIVLAVFDEGVQILEQAAAFPTLAAARWYGSEGMAGNAALLTNAAARTLAMDTQFTCTEPDEYTNALYSAVSDAIEARTGSRPRPYAMHAYDALWLAALALRDTGGTGTVQEVRAAIRSEAAGYDGASGPVLFNAADDRSDGLFQCVRVTDSNEWTNILQTIPEPPDTRAASGLAVNSFRAQWGSSAGALEYFLDVSAGAGFDPADYVATFSNQPLGAVHSHAVTGLTPGETYYYRVRAGNAEGVSPNSSVIPVTLPTSSVIQASANAGGWLVPSGAVNVEPMASVDFTVTASNYYEIAEIRTNGSPLAGVDGLTCYTHRWETVTSDGEFVAVFRALTAVNDVPLWWLAQYYTVTTNGDELSVSDSDVDGFPAWQEYIAGTVPTNFESRLCFKLIEQASGSGLVPRWNSATDRLYTLYYSADTAEGIWTCEPTCVDVPGTGGELCFTNSLPQVAGFYRLGVCVEP